MLRGKQQGKADIRSHTRLIRVRPCNTIIDPKYSNLSKIQSIIKNRILTTPTSVFEPEVHSWYSKGGGGIYTILVIGEWPVLLKRELAIL